MSGGEKRRGAMRILEALGAVDESLLAQCEDDSAGKRRPRMAAALRYGSAAACLVLLAAGSLAFGLMRQKGAGEGVDTTAFQDNSAAAIQQDAGEAFDTSGTWETADAGGEAFVPAGGGEDSALETEGASEADAEEELQGDRESASATQESLAEKEKGAGMGLAQHPLTEEQARSVDVVSAYLPARLPQGYVFDAAWHYGEQQDNVSMSWVREGEHLTISVYLVEDPDGLETVDVDAPQTYDRRLDAVAESEKDPGRVYQGIFWDPIFESGDLSLEVVSSRMVCQTGTAGEGQTPEGDFSVLYPGGILLHLAGSAAPEEVWEMLEGIGTGQTP